MCGNVTLLRFVVAQFHLALCKTASNAVEIGVCVDVTKTFANKMRQIGKSGFAFAPRFANRSVELAIPSN